MIEKYDLCFGKRKRSHEKCNQSNKPIEIHIYLCKYINKEKLKNIILYEMAHTIDFELNKSMCISWNDFNK